MSSIWDAIVYVYATLAVVPVIPFLVVYLIMAVRGADRRAAFRLSMDITTIFLLGIVASLLNSRTGSHFGMYFIALVMLVGAGLIGNAQNRLRGRINAPRIFRAIWRLSFIALSLLYVLLLSLELISPTQR
jgi:hypothetical protein